MNININTQRYSEVDLLSVKGRIGRKLYFFYSSLVPFISFWIFSSFAEKISKQESGNNTIAYTLLGMAILAVLLMVVHLTIKRCHDFNQSGWMAIFALIPFANIIFSLIPSDNGLNKYGEPAKPDSAFIKTAVIIFSILLIALVAYSFLYLFNNGITLY